MSIKIAYTVEKEADGSSRHIAEGVTSDGTRVRTLSLVTASDFYAHGTLIESHAKRQVLRNLLDQAIHQELL